MSRTSRILGAGIPSVLLVAGLLLLPLTSLPAPARAEPPEWVISTPTTLQDTVKDVKANVIIEGGGELKLLNSTLIMNSTGDGDFELRVKTGGKLSADHGTITCGPTRARYWFNVAGDLDVRDSEVRGTRGMFDAGGIYITSGTTSLVRCRLPAHQWFAVYLNGSAASATIMGCTLEDSKAGIKVQGGAKALIEGNTIKGMEKEGIMAIGSSPTIRGNAIRESWRGIGLYESKATITGNDITNCGSLGIECAKESDATISSNNITNCGDAGISSISSMPKITSNYIFANGVGINISGSGPAISKNTIAGNRGWGIYSTSGSPALDGNKFEDNSGNYNALGGAVLLWRLKLTVLDSVKKPVEEADVTVKDKAGKLIYKGRTASDGTIPELLLVQKHVNATGSGDSTPHKVQVSYKDLSDTLSITMDKDQVVTATLGAKDKPFLPGMGAPLLLLAFLAAWGLAVGLRPRK